MSDWEGKEREQGQWKGRRERERERKEREGKETHLCKLHPKDHLLPRSHKNLHAGSEEYVVVRIRERSLPANKQTNQRKNPDASRQRETKRAKGGRKEVSKTHPVPFNQSIPPSHEPLPDDILELSLRVRLLVERVGDSLVAVLEERSKPRSDELIEELIGSSLRKNTQKKTRERKGKED